MHLAATLPTQRCFFGWPLSRTSSRASARGLVSKGNDLGRRLR